MTSDELALKQLALSGYPFQMRVQEEVKATADEHGWEVVTDEYAWSNRTGGAQGVTESGFIDLVLQHSAIRALRMVIECKRMRGEDARGLQWLFPIPAGREGASQFVRGLTAAYSHERRHYVRAWDNLLWTPPSMEAEFCVTYSDQPRQKPQLENLSADLLASTEGLLEEEIKVAVVSKNTLRAFYIPAIVTNVTLKACVFDVASVALTDGIIQPDACRIEEVPYLRFRKSLSTEFPSFTPVSDLKTANQMKERTVFIINANHLTDFLKQCRLEGPLPGHFYAVSQSQQ